VTEHDLAVLERVRAERTSLVVEAEEPEVVAEAIVADGARRVPPAELGTWVEEAALLRERADAVLAAEVVVAGAIAHEQAARAALLGQPAEVPPDDVPAPASTDDDERHEHDEDGELDGARADRQAVRFALAVLLPAQLAGLAVYVADGTLLAVLAPALALVYVLLTAVTHRTPDPPSAVPVHADPSDEGPARAGTLREEVRTPTTGDAGAAPGDVTGRPDGVGRLPEPPALRTAHAHLRRQQAAWKLAWWERGLAPLDVATWVGRPGDEGEPSTILVVDRDREVDEVVLARLTAAVPAAVRVVLVRAVPA